MLGKIIFLNGASSSAKSTLCRGLQATLPEPFWHVSIDDFRDRDILPLQRIRSGEFPWDTLRPAFFDGFHRSLAAYAGAGNNLLVEYIVETDESMAQLLDLLEPFDVFSIGVRCPLPELERRERERGDRPIGDARRDDAMTHTLIRYDCEIDSTLPLAENVQTAIAAWQSRTRPQAFDRMRASRLS